MRSKSEKNLKKYSKMKFYFKIMLAIKKIPNG